MARRRSTGTEAKIKAAFTQLLKEKGFDAMTVSDLARVAGINRGTFYMHYMDKYDLRQQLLDNAQFELRRLLQAQPGTPTRAADEAQGPGLQRAAAPRHPSVLDVITPQATLAALQYIRNDAAFFDAVTHGGQDLAMYESTKTILRRMLQEKADEMRIVPSMTAIPSEYSLEIVASSVTSIIWLWVRRGFRETPEDITRYIELNKRMTPLSLLR